MTGKELEQIYNEAYKAVYWTALSLLKNESDAEDVVQDTFVSFIESYSDMTDTSKATALLKKIAANKCLDRIKLAKTDNMDEEFFDSVEAVPEDFLPDTIVESAEMRKIIMDIIEQSLSEDIRRTLILFYFDEMSTKEIAEALGVPQGTVLRRLNFARNKIKKEVEKYEKEKNTKLFGAAMALPFLSKLFIKEAEALPFKAMPASLTTSLSASVKASAKEAGTKIAAEAAKKGTSIMLKKIIGICIAVVAVGAVTGGIIFFVNKAADDKPKEKEEEVEEIEEEEIEEIEEMVSEESVSDYEIFEGTEPSETDEAGYETITFGSYQGEPIEWIVLDTDEDGNMFVLSKYALTAMQYDTTLTEVTWETCTLRQWLNNDFYNEAFSADEKSCIILSNVTNPNMTWPEPYDVTGGNDTQDYIFLLSFDEAVEYFDCLNPVDKTKAQCEATDYAVTQYVFRYDDIHCEWWLRSPGGDNLKATLIGYDGCPQTFNGNESPLVGVRPAMWITP